MPPLAFHSPASVGPSTWPPRAWHSSSPTSSSERACASRRSTSASFQSAVTESGAASPVLPWRGQRKRRWTLADRRGRPRCPAGGRRRRRSRSSVPGPGWRACQRSEVAAPAGWWWGKGFGKEVSEGTERDGGARPGGDDPRRGGSGLFGSADGLPCQTGLAHPCGAADGTGVLSGVPLTVKPNEATASSIDSHRLIGYLDQASAAFEAMGGTASCRRR